MVVQVQLVFKVPTIAGINPIAIPVTDYIFPSGTTDDHIVANFPARRAAERGVPRQQDPSPVRRTRNKLIGRTERRMSTVMEETIFDSGRECIESDA